MSEEKKTDSDQMTNRKRGRFSPIFFEVSSGMGAVEKGIHWVISIIMIILSLIIIGGIVLSFRNVPRYFSAIINNEPDALVMLLEFVAGLIIAIELIYVIVAQNLESVVEILMIALTRELIIKYLETWEILIGIIGVAVLFAIRKFLMAKKDKEPNVSD